MGRERVRMSIREIEIGRERRGQRVIGKGEKKLDREQGEREIGKERLKKLKKRMNEEKIDK